jgi:hypothetical protein
MKIAVCFFGEMSFMDRFMIQNLMRCLIVPFQKYNHKGHNVEFYYFLHTYFNPSVLTWIGMMRASFPFTSMTIHDRESVLREKKDAHECGLFLQGHSLNRVKKKWKMVDDLDLVMMVRLDLLLTKSLSEGDIDLVLHHKHHLFLHEKKPFVAMGDPMVMNLFADKFLHFCGADHLFDILRTQHNVKIQSLSLVFVRILPDAIVCPEDYHVCPYLGDLIASSQTQIRLVKRKNSNIR